MAEPQSNRNPAEGSAPRGDSQLRLVRPPQVLPEADAEPTDDAPTVISKNPPLHDAVQATPPNAEFLTGNLHGRTLAHFELLEPIGVGGMAAVIRARDKQLDRTVALKVLPPDMAGDAENIRRFHQEARAAAKLDHENIARVFFCGEDQRLHFIAFEFVEGQNLKTILERRKRIPVPEAVRYMLQIAAGLEHAATRGVVHRDIKPSNIIISPNGRAKLVDMGLARSMGPQTDALTQSGVTLGTFDYISPEQALEPRDADTRSDIYSLGCTFYHMLTGQAPVPEGTAAKKLQHHQNVEPVDPRVLNDQIPDEVALILVRMMAKDPKNRYQRPVHLVQHLMQVAQKVGAADDLPEGVLFVDAPLLAEPQQRPLIVFGAAALGLIAFVMVVGFFNSTPVPPPPGIKLSAKDGAPPSELVRATSVPVPSHSAKTPFEKLKEDLADRSRREIKLSNQILDFSESLTFNGDRDLVIAPRFEGVPLIIRMKYDGTGVPWAGFELKGTIRFRNIRFELEATDSSPSKVVTMLRLWPGAKATFEGCSFHQYDQTLERRSGFLNSESKSFVPIASVVLDNSSDSYDAPEVKFAGCFFQRGQEAVAVHGVGHVTATQCAFGGHGALFHLLGDGKDYNAKISLHACSALLLRGPAFRFDQKACCQLKIDETVVSWPRDLRYSDPNDDRPNLMHQTSSGPLAVRYTGRNNYFHNYNLVYASPSRVLTFDQFNAEAKLEPAKGEGDSGSVFIVQGVKNGYPWANTNLDPLDIKPDRDFRLNLSLAELQKVGPVGVENFLSYTVPRPTRTTELAPIVRKDYQKIVDPEGPEVPADGLFKTLDAALLRSQPGDEILIKHAKNNPRIDLKPQRLEHPDLHVLLKAYEGYHPILTMAKTTQSDAAMFRIYDGTLKFENLRLEQEADQDGFTALSIATIEGNGTVSFTRCVLTLKENKDYASVPLSVVTLLRPEQPGMMGDKRPAEPKVSFQDSFIRGEGDLLLVRGNRRMQVDLEHALVALRGHAFHIKGGSMEKMESVANIKLKQVSSFVRDSFVHFHLPNGKGPVTTVIDVEKSLLLGSKDGMIATGPDNMDLADLMKWSGRENTYVGYETFNTVGLKWREPETANYPTVKFAQPTAALSRSLPEQFKISDPANLPGVDFERLPHLSAVTESGDE